MNTGVRLIKHTTEAGKEIYWNARDLELELRKKGHTVVADWLEKLRNDNEE